MLNKGRPSKLIQPDTILSSTLLLELLGVGRKGKGENWAVALVTEPMVITIVPATAKNRSITKTPPCVIEGVGTKGENN
jgi:hypothetical protein